MSEQTNNHYEVFVQTKPTIPEWIEMEKPVSNEECMLLEFIKKGFHNPDICINANKTIIQIANIATSPEIDNYLYEEYFEKLVTDLCKEIPSTHKPFEIEKKTNKHKKPLNKGDKIKIENVSNNIVSNRGNIFEYVLLDNATICIRESDFITALYSLIHFQTIANPTINIHVKKFITYIIETYSKYISIKKLIHSSNKVIEQNKLLLRYANMELYSHQRDLFRYFNSPVLEPALYLYIAPTGSGKTVTPIGLSEKYKVIFVCGSRHIAMALAKSAISVKKKIAFALGCSATGDIRLHNFSAVDFERDKRSGGIARVDDSNGINVEIMISDIQSYPYALLYMKQYNLPNEMVLFWDEPTISMDYDSHPLHPYINANWKKNEISCVILSCATLPSAKELYPVISDFTTKFIDAECRIITSFDCKKSITLLNSDGYRSLPHTLFSNYRDLNKSVEHCKENKTVLRYFDLEEVVRCIELIHKINDENDSSIIADEYIMDNYFSNETDTMIEITKKITMSSIKIYYLELLLHINPSFWKRIYENLQFTKTKKFQEIKNNEIRKIKSNNSAVNSTTTTTGKLLTRMQSVDSSKNENTNPSTNIVVSTKSASSFDGILLTTKDAHTLTDGPTMYLAEDVKKMGQFYLMQSGIPKFMMETIMANIDFNNTIQSKLSILQKSIDDEQGKEKEKENKMINERFSREVKEMYNQMDTLQTQIKTIELNHEYLPNYLEHQQKWIGMDSIIKNAFRSNVDEQTVKQIMVMNIESYLKVLLMMGIGTFIANLPHEYMEVMKRLASEQRLYLIIASSDYVYGTNYQSCHGFIGKDMKNMTQQKTMQSLGRIGRGNIQQEYTVRFRNDDLLTQLFVPMEYNKEAYNMNRLFCSD